MGDLRDFWTARCLVCGRSVQASGPPLGWACSRHAPILIGPLTEAERTRQALDVALDKLGAPELRRVLELASRLVPPPAGRAARFLVTEHSAGVPGVFPRPTFLKCARCGTAVGDGNGPCKCPGWGGGGSTT